MQGDESSRHVTNVPPGTVPTVPTTGGVPAPAQRTDLATAGNGRTGGASEWGAPETAREARAKARAEALRTTSLLLARTRSSFSEVRMDAFLDPRDPSKNTPSWVLGRYWYNVAYAESLYPSLHILEVGLRNAIYNAIAEERTEHTGVDIADCWLDWPDAVTVLRVDPAASSRDDFGKVKAAKREILKDRRELSAGRLIAELNFGFWTGLFSGYYGGREGGGDDARRLWPDLLPGVFPNLAASERKRSVIAARLNSIRHLRNRSYHHEPIWQRKLLVDFNMIVETIGWIDELLAEMAKDNSRVRVVSERGIGGYEKQARDFALSRFPAEDELSPSAAAPIEPVGVQSV